MRPNRKSLKLLTLVALVAMADASCRPASYEILKPKKGHDVRPNGNPEQVNPPAGNTVPPATGTPPGTPTSTPTTSGDNAAPTARVEVIWKNESVVKVRVNEPTIIRPTADTVDPDDVGKSPCANPGIVKAAYDVGHEAAPSAERASGCEPLSVPYTFTKTGDYEITMVVTSNENETATAKMTVTVIAADAPLYDGDGGFTITADPMIGGKDQVFTFTGYCALKKEHVITWEFGDGKGGEGVVVTHAYAELGPHDVKGHCTDLSRKTIDAQIVVVTWDHPVTPPVNPTKPVLPPAPPVVTPLPTNPTIPTTPPNQGQPGQKPNQGTDGKPTQGTQQQPPLVDCPCTDPGSGNWYDPEQQYYVPY